MINLEALADRIAAAKTRPMRAAVEDQVLREIEADSRATLAAVHSLRTFSEAVTLGDYARLMCDRVPLLYDTVPVPPGERRPILSDWDTRIDRSKEIYCEAADKAAEVADRLVSAMPAGTPTPTPTGRPGAGAGRGKDTRPEGWWAWVGAAAIAVVGFLLGVPGAGIILGLLFALWVHFSGKSKPVPGLPPPPPLWLLPVVVLVLLFSRR